MSTNSSRLARSRKSTASKASKPRKYFVPPKPYQAFPLTPHASGKWMKKIRGQLCYFGNWGRVRNGKMERLPGDGWEEALADYKSKSDDLHAGRPPQTEIDKLTVKQLCNQFLTAMFTRLQAGRKMSHRMFAEYRATAATMAAVLGKNRLVIGLRPADFSGLGYKLNERCGTVRLGNEVQRVKTIFKYAVDNELILKSPNFGSEFKKPDKSELRKHRAEGGKRLFTAAEIRQLLDGKASQDDKGEAIHVAGAKLQLRAMILLGINCGFGNTDVSSLPKSKMDLDVAMIDFPRPKTGVDRRCPLWPETVEALKAAIAERPTPKAKADADCAFLTAQGNRWVRDHVTTGEGDEENNFSKIKVTAINSVGLEFGKLLRRLGINGRKGLGFYTLRHTFRTIADASKDFPAARMIMGHADGSIDDVYREGIDDVRLEAVTAHVRKWLFGDRVK